MKQRPRMIDRIHLPVEIEIHNYMRDYQFNGKSVLPAVETCRVLAFNIKKHMPEFDPCSIYEASFDKFIGIQPDQNLILLYNEIEKYENGEVISRLLTKTELKKPGITQTMEHAILKFKREQFKLRKLPYDIASGLNGTCLHVPSRKIYNGLVQFGPAFHNIEGDIHLTRDGAIAKVTAPLHPAPIAPLGSPFPFDAALHAACVWGQRFAGIVAFPVGFDKRYVIQSTAPGETYFSRIIPLKKSAGSLEFEIWIYDRDGRLYEYGCGIKLKDMNPGMQTPPEWIQDGRDDSLRFISEQCEACSVIELDSMADFAERAFSEVEWDRQKSMGEKRKKSFTGARLACKRLSRMLARDDRITPANNITTISSRIYPACPLPDGSAPYRCSASHDSRFAFAAASRRRIGVDVETLSERTLKLRHRYMSKEENELVSSSPLGAVEASLRVWSIKEAVTKALDIKLAESWRIARVANIGENTSAVLLDGEQITAFHDTIDDHLFTLIEIE